MSGPDFYVPHEGGHLPMGIVRMTVEEEGGDTPFGLRRVRMTIEAVSVGAPIFGDASIRPTREIKS